MTNKNQKLYKVTFIDSSLNQTLKKLKEGKKSDKELYSSIVKAIEHLKTSPLDSIIIKKKQIPKSYIKEYGINNLRLIKLNRNWRLVYTIASDDIQIVSIILDFFNHKEYEQKFEYTS